MGVVVCDAQILPSGVELWKDLRLSLSALPPLSPSRRPWARPSSDQHWHLSHGHPSVAPGISSLRPASPFRRPGQAASKWWPLSQAIYPDSVWTRSCQSSQRKPMLLESRSVGLPVPAALQQNQEGLCKSAWPPSDYEFGLGWKQVTSKDV